MLYQIFYWIHIASYIAWLLAFIVSLYFAVKIWIEDDTLNKRRFMQAERKVTGIGAHLAALGILISGGAMASMPAGPQWGWFSLIYPWLTLKQLLFLMILVLIGFSIKRSNAFRKYLKNGGDILDSQITDKWKGAYKISLSVYILVVVNTLLGLFKPY